MPIIRLCKSLVSRTVAGLCGLNDRLERLMPALLEAFGSAAMASLSVSPFYPLPDDRPPAEWHPEPTTIDPDETLEDEVVRS
ncbi:hypothetical protein ACLE20_02930 [Rhizobium sp. YIM 134829]|uniref:hypothetical protein n=1 Tax=Rhizobium sp. YIM 134829 TaxID=3390453 RepID=UPI00397BAA2D